VVVGRGRDAGEVPEIALPLVYPRVLAASVEEENAGRALNEPTAVEALDASLPHRVERCGQMRVLRLLRLDFHRRGLVGERADEAVAVAELLHGDGHLGLDDGVDTADLVGYLPGAFEQKRVAHVALCGFRHIGRKRWWGYRKNGSRGRRTPL
jgi:hypothetical protein